MKCEITFEYQSFMSEELLDSRYNSVLAAAQDAVHLSYAPYSKFYVGAAVLLGNGAIVKGGNQENASFPAGICAERVALSIAYAQYPNEQIVILAITYSNPENPDNQKSILSPCGICRQSMLESIDRQKASFQVLLSNPGGNIILLEDARQLLPLAFSSSNL